MTFKEYLSQKFQEIYQGGDDGMADAEDEWLTELHVDQVIEWAEDWRHCEWEKFRINTLKAEL